MPITEVDECFVCQKQRNLSTYVGDIIAERGGLLLTHFPYLVDEAATRGHLIIEPRRHLTDLEDMNDAEAGALGPLIKHGTQLLKQRLLAEHVYLLRINDKVPHLHFHLVPRYPGTPKEFWGAKLMGWPDRPTVGLAEIRVIAEQLK